MCIPVGFANQGRSRFADADCHRFTMFCAYYATFHPLHILLRDGTRMPCPRAHIEALSKNHSAVLDVSTDAEMFTPLLNQTQWKCVRAPGNWEHGMEHVQQWECDRASLAYAPHPPMTPSSCPMQPPLTFLPWWMIYPPTCPGAPSIPPPVPPPCCSTYPPEVPCVNGRVDCGQPARQTAVPRIRHLEAGQPAVRCTLVCTMVVQCRGHTCT